MSGLRILTVVQKSSVPTGLLRVRATANRPFEQKCQSSTLQCEKCDLIKNNNRSLANLVKRNAEVRELLLKLSEFDLEKVHAPKMNTYCVNKTEVKLITNEDLKEMREKAQRYYEDRIKFSPVPLFSESDETHSDTLLSSDEALEGIDLCTLTFVDISAESLKYPEGRNKLKEHSRKVWERRPNGDLWLSGHGSDSTRDIAVKSIYKKVYREPTGQLEIFENKEHFGRLLYEGQFRYLITMAYQNFLLDDPKLMKIISSIFTFICDNNLYDSIKSTKHFHLLLFHILANVEETFSYLKFIACKRKSKEIISVFQLRQLLFENLSPKNGNSSKSEDNFNSSDMESSDEDFALKLLEQFMNENSRFVSSKVSQELNLEVKLWHDSLHHSVADKTQEMSAI